MSQSAGGRGTGPAADDPGRGRSVTIADVAGHAGVSIPTVSKVINGRANVSAETRQRVEAAIRERGYQRRKRLAHQADLIEVIFHRLESDWALEILRGVQDVARRHRLGVVLSECSDGHRPAGGWVEDVVTRRPMGMLSVCAELSQSQREALSTNGIPLVMVDPQGEPVHETPSVGAANWSGGYCATRHLLDLGHRRIDAISGPHDVLCARARLDGYRAAMDGARGVARGSSRAADFTVDGGREAARALLADAAVRPTAIFAGNDLQAFGAYEVARELGLRVPQDLSVVGFDDLPVATWMGPPLTTVRQPLVEMASAAMELLLGLCRGDQPAQQRIELSTHLVVRGSTAPLTGS